MVFAFPLAIFAGVPNLSGRELVLLTFQQKAWLVDTPNRLL